MDVSTWGNFVGQERLKLERGSRCKKELQGMLRTGDVDKCDTGGSDDGFPQVIIKDCTLGMNDEGCWYFLKY